jgi:hypothetical protein
MESSLLIVATRRAQQNPVTVNAAEQALMLEYRHHSGRFNQSQPV